MLAVSTTGDTYRFLGWAEERSPTEVNVTRLDFSFFNRNYVISYLRPTLPRGVHFFCLPKRNEPKKRAPDIAFIQKLTLFDGVVENSLRSNTRPLNPSTKLNFWRQYNGTKNKHLFPVCADE